jgi:hypothetical protein
MPGYRAYHATGDFAPGRGGSLQLRNASLSPCRPWGSRGESRPPAPRRTRRERLRSPGSHHSATRVVSTRSSAPPASAVDRQPSLSDPALFAPSALPDFIATTRQVGPRAPHRYSPPPAFGLKGSPSRDHVDATRLTPISRRQVPTFYTGAWTELAPPVCRMPPEQ